jgi:hypothetical protein
LIECSPQGLVHFPGKTVEGLRTVKRNKGYSAPHFIQHRCGDFGHIVSPEVLNVPLTDRSVGECFPYELTD